MMYSLNHRYRELHTNEFAFRRLTGFRPPEFEALHEPFSRAWTEYFNHYTLDGKSRHRRVSVRKNNIFTNTQDVLLFALLYHKGNVLQEELATQFGIDQPKASKYLYLINKLLNKILDEDGKVLSKPKLKRIKQAVTMNGESQ